MKLMRSINIQAQYSSSIFKFNIQASDLVTFATQPNLLDLGRDERSKSVMNKAMDKAGERSFRIRKY